MKMITFQIFLLFLLRFSISQDNVSVPMTNYDFWNPNQCTVTQTDANKVQFFFEKL